MPVFSRRPPAAWSRGDGRNGKQSERGTLAGAVGASFDKSLGNFAEQPPKVPTHAPSEAAHRCVVVLHDFGGEEPPQQPNPHKTEFGYANLACPSAGYIHRLAGSDSKTMLPTGSTRNAIRCWPNSPAMSGLALADSSYEHWLLKPVLSVRMTASRW